LEAVVQAITVVKSRVNDGVMRVPAILESSKGRISAVLGKGENALRRLGVNLQLSTSQGCEQSELR